MEGQKAETEDRRDPIAPFQRPKCGMLQIPEPISCIRVALIGRELQPFSGDRDILFDTYAFRVAIAEQLLPKIIAVLGSFLDPFDGFGDILCDTLTPKQTVAIR